MFRKLAEQSIVILTYNAHMKCSSSCLKVDSASRSAIRDIMIEASSSFLVREIARCSSSLERALSSFSLLRRDFSRRSSSSYVIRCNRREVEGTLWISNCDTLPLGSTRLRFCRAGVGSASDAATVVGCTFNFKEVGFRRKKFHTLAISKSG